MKADATEGIVVDASVGAAWFLEERGSEAALALLRGTPPRFHVPPIWLAEMCNVFLTHERSGGCEAGETARWLALLAEMPLAFDGEANDFAGGARVLELARAHRLSVYDAQYLELAQRRRLPVASLDRKLAAAARALGIELAIASGK